MLKRFIRAVAAAFRAFCDTFQASAAMRPPRPVWDNGTDYNIPAYLRRGGGLTLKSSST